MISSTQNGLAKSVAEIVQRTFVIPFYQRNYNWGAAEITQFLQDIYESYSNNPNQNYYIGSLVVYGKRKNSNRLEVIDGQQRLTTIHILSRLFPHKSINPAKLKYDSRHEVESFLDRLKLEKECIKQTEEDQHQRNLNNFFAAIETIVNTKLDGEIDSILSLQKLRETKDLVDFIEYFYNKVMLVEVRMPPDTDVANYFEIMNNRGRQLQEHEILKAQLMSKIDIPKERSVFGYIWDACSQMDRPIQKFFNPEQRTLLFGENYDVIKTGNLSKISRANAREKSYSIIEILENKTQHTTPVAVVEHEAEIDQEINYTAIIDFTNFLIHVLKLTFPKADVPLSSDKLLKIYKAIPSRILAQVEPMEFLKKLFFYRIVFDRFIVKSAAGSENADQFDEIETHEAEGLNHTRWILTKPVMYWKNYAYKGRKYQSLNFKNTFDDPDLQERIVKLLSMLQVTYRQRKNKNYLQFVLSLVDPANPKTLGIEAGLFLKRLEEFTLLQFDKLNLETYLGVGETSNTDGFSIYSEGTNTPHFIFNFIDYLLWVDSVWNDKMLNIDKDFEFTYRNSIEHHFPQAQIHMLEGNKELRDKLMHCLGNLCLISKGANSKLNDRSAWDKATDPRYSGGVLTPKRKIMYSTTQKHKKWNTKQLLAHYSEIINLLKKRNEILNGNYK